MFCDIKKSFGAIHGPVFISFIYFFCFFGNFKHVIVMFVVSLRHGMCVSSEDL